MADNIYIIPFGYAGKINVVYCKKNGQRIRYDHGSIVFQIPPDGILITKGILRSQLDSSLFFYILKNGNKKKLEILHHTQIINSKDSIALKNKVGIIIFGTLNECEPTMKNNLYYSDFYVGSENELPQYYTPERAE